MDNVKDVAINGHVLALKNDGTLWTWGMGNFGTLGQGLTETGHKEPVQILDHVNKIAAEYNDSFAVKTDGSLWAWGLNIGGVLADANVHDFIDDNGYYIQTVPVQVMTGVTDIASGHGIIYIIKNDGTLWSCGANQFGEAGIGNAGESVLEPVQILEHVVHVIAGDCICYAIKDDDTLWSWGTNGKGELGYFGGDGWSNIGPLQTYPRQVLFFDGKSESLEKDISVLPNVANIIIDGNSISFPVLMSYDQQGGGTTYIRPRDLAYAFNDTRSNFNVKYDDATGLTSLLIGSYMPTGDEMVPPDLKDQTVKIKRTTFGSSSTQNVEYYNTITVKDTKGNSHTYIRLRDLAPSHYFDVIWDWERIIVNTGTWYTWSEF